MVEYFTDIETYEKRKDGYLYPKKDTQKYTIGGICDQKSKIRYFKNKEEHKEHIIKEAKKLEKQKKNMKIRAHYANYDFYALFQKEIINQEWEIIRNEPLIAKHRTLPITWLDTYAIVARPLEEIGKMLKKEKQKMPPKIKDAEELKTYLERDIEIIRELIKTIKKTMKKIGKEPRNIWTTPQIAGNNFIEWLKKNKKTYGILEIRGKKETRIIKNKNEEQTRKAYRLGRCEAFQTGTFEKVTHIDQNRQFPYAATKIRVPNLKTEIRIKDATKIKNMIDINKTIKQLEGIATATIKTPTKEEIGILPIKTSDYDFIIPKGKHKITGTWTFIELRKAKEIGYKIEEIHDIIIYQKLKNNPFKEYFKEIYEIEKNNPEMKIVTKLLMNGLIGKLGGKNKRTTSKIIKREEFNKYLHEGWHIGGEVGNKINMIKEEEYDNKYSNVILAAMITAQSRIEMYDELKKIPKEDLIYTDTDSIIFKGHHLHKFKIGNELGEFKIESKGETCEIIKEKAYKIGKTIKVSGLSRQLHTEEAFNSLKLGITIKQDKLITINNEKEGEIGRFRETEFTLKEQAKKDIQLEYEIKEE